MDNPEVRVKDERIGRETKLIEQVCRKLQRGKSADEIAEALAPDYNADEVYRSWKR